MRNKHRSHLQIIADILFVARAGSKKTHIMYGANLSYMLTQRYLKYTIESGLIWHNSGIYTLTQKGKEFLKKYKEYSQYRKEISSQEEVLKKMCSRDQIQSI